jgi:hypothetical protein
MSVYLAIFAAGNVLFCSFSFRLFLLFLIIFGFFFLIFLIKSFVLSTYDSPFVFTFS